MKWKKAASLFIAVSMTVTASASPVMASGPEGTVTEVSSEADVGKMLDTAMEGIYDSQEGGAGEGLDQAGEGLGLEGEGLDQAGEGSGLEGEGSDQAGEGSGLAGEGSDQAEEESQTPPASGKEDRREAAAEELFGAAEEEGLAGAEELGEELRENLAKQAQVLETDNVIESGKTMYDTNGRPIQAHGGGFLKVPKGTQVNSAGERLAEDTYYWVGEDKSNNSAIGNPVHMYKSSDLVNWIDVGVVLGPKSKTATGRTPLNHCKLERPKLVFNAKTGQYVLWVHYETSVSYSASELLVATSKYVEGNGVVKVEENSYQNATSYDIVEQPTRIGETVTADSGKVHFRPASGDNDPQAFGDRYGSGIEDWDSALGNSKEWNPTRPAQAEYPLFAELYDDAPEIRNTKDVTVVADSQNAGKNQITVSGLQEATKTDQLPNGITAEPGEKYRLLQEGSISNKVRDMEDGDYGVSGLHTGGDWWSYHLNDLQNDTTLKAATVRMSDYDPTYYYLYQKSYHEAYQNPGSVQSKNDYLLRYPAQDADGNVVASETVSQQYDIVDNEADETKWNEMKDPVIHPDKTETQLDGTVLLNPYDMVFITCDTQYVGDRANIVSLHYTVDGSEPTQDSPSYNRGWMTQAFVYDKAKMRNGAISVKEAVDASGDNTFTLKVAAITKDGQQKSATVSQKFRIVTDEEEQKYTPVYKPVLPSPSGRYAGVGYKELKMFCPTYDAEVYYTVDGADPVKVLPRKGDNLGYGSRDFTVYEDPKTGKAYLITAQDHIYIRVWELNDDYTNVNTRKEYDIYVGNHREAPALVRTGMGTADTADDFVYLFTSAQSGWSPNQGQYARTQDIANGFNQPRIGAEKLTDHAVYMDLDANGTLARDGLYPNNTNTEHKTEAKGQGFGYRNGQAAWSDLQPFGDSTNYRSQPTKIFDIGTPEKPQYIFMGDRWNEGMLAKSTYCFYQLEIDSSAKGPMGADSGLAKLTYNPRLKLEKKADGNIVIIDLPQKNLLRQEGVEIIGHSKVKASSTLFIGAPDPAGKSDWITSEAQNQAFLEACRTGVMPQKDPTTGYVYQDTDKISDMPYIKYTPDQLIDGIDWDLDNYDEIQQFFMGEGFPFWVEIKLPKPAKLDWAGISTRLVGGSEASNRLVIKAKNEGDEGWKEILDHSQTSVYGFQEGSLNGVYQYLRLEVLGNAKGTWASGVFELQVGGQLIAQNTEGLATLITKGQDLVKNHASEYTFETMSSLQNILKEVEGLYASGGVTEAEVTEFTKKLEGAINGLVKNGNPTPGPSVTGIRLKKEKADLIAGGYLILEEVLTPEGAVSKVEWKSSNPKVADVDPNKGVVEARKAGKAVITATAEGKTAKCTLTVYNAAKALGVKASGYTLAGNKLVLAKGKKAVLKAAVTTKGAKKGVTFESSKPSVIKVASNGTLTAKKAGKARITVASSDGRCKKTYTVYVAAKAANATKVTSKVKTISLTKKGDTYNLAAKLSCSKKGTSANKITSKYIYKSSNTKAVKVDKYGVVKAVKKGKAVITVKNGKGAVKITVKVKK
ncbi:MAG: hypothetical protein HFH38_05345 [Lachnospiraceae bacterium]|nr:hypothetical protein [Lachnospiraceae bacterium]